MTDTSPLPYHVEVGEVGDSLHIVRDSGVQEPAVEAANYLSRGDIFHAHGDDADAVGLIPEDDFGVVRTVIGEEANLGVVGDGAAKTEVEGEGGDAAGTVAAHSGGMAVAVVITHGEVKAIGGVLEQEEAVGTDTETAMADVDYLVGGKLEGRRTVVDGNEVIASAVVFTEGDFHLVRRLVRVRSTRLRSKS